MAALVDTNIIVYRFDPRFPQKQRIATDLLRRGLADGSLRLPHQAVVEFVAATTRPVINGEPLLEPDEARPFFERQALKIATRNLACTAVFDSTGGVASRVAAAFGVDLRPLLEELRSLDADCVFDSRLDSLLQTVAASPTTIALARRLEKLMGEAHRPARLHPADRVPSVAGGPPHGDMD